MKQFSIISSLLRSVHDNRQNMDQVPDPFPDYLQVFDHDGMCYVVRLQNCFDCADMLRRNSYIDGEGAPHRFFPEIKLQS